jgi:predicted amidohydrolase
MYRKIHITPNEVFHWGITGGDTNRPLTLTGKINRDLLRCGISELSRLMADQGMNILFVPFLTDTQNGYTRVKHCAQARAIENECYVAIAGCVGNLPKSTIWIFSMHKRLFHPLILHSQQWNQSRNNKQK